MQVNMLDAKNSLSRLVAAAERGEDVILARDGKPIVKIVRYDAPKVRAPGAWKSKVKVSRNWDSATTNAAVAELFESSAKSGL
jgi:prevent-host-death family protein